MIENGNIIDKIGISIFLILGGVSANAGCAMNGGLQGPIQFDLPQNES